MFKWPGTPSAHAPEHELADFAELVCWQHRSTSTTALCADLGRLEENDYSAGVPEEDKVTEVVEEAYLEIERRVTACRDAGSLFDRCRIVDFCDDLTKDVFAKVKTWTEAAAAATALPV